MSIRSSLVAIALPAVVSSVAVSVPLAARADLMSNAASGTTSSTTGSGSTGSHSSTTGGSTSGSGGAGGSGTDNGGGCTVAPGNVAGAFGVAAVPAAALLFLSRRRRR